MPLLKYNASWPDGTDPLKIELGCIAKGGKWQNTEGEECGAGTIDHLMNARKLLWPDRYRHRWTDLMYEEFVRNDITILMGAASTQKTSHASEFVLMNYWARPKKTLVILSTMSLDKLDTGVFGEVKMLWQAGRARWDWLDGYLLENRRAITTDNIDVGSRDMRKGIIGRACYVSGRWVGLGVLAGTKQEYVFYLCDEIQFMGETFIGSWPNLFSNGNVKIIGSGNPQHDPDDQLGIAAEPKDGWSSQGDNQKTVVWETQFLNGRCVNLVGPDSPNFDAPEGEPEPYPKLIGRKFATRIAHDWGANSPEYYTQVMGVMRLDMADKRIITRQICRQHHALDMAQWAGGPLTRVYGLDPSYGGGDLCIGIPLEFGLGEEGLILVAIMAVVQIRIDLRRLASDNTEMSAEDQVAEAVDLDLKRFGIPVENCFYDPYGKGTMGFAFARRFGANCPIPIDSGGQPTERPVRQDLYIDLKDGQRRLKTCAEHYDRRISENWFGVRYAIEANQLRNLPQDVMLEGSARKYKMAAGNRIAIESKDDYKLRVKHSPNKFDALAIGTEGARLRGFVIGKLGPVDTLSSQDEWFDKEAKEYQEAISKCLLKH